LEVVQVQAGSGAAGALGEREVYLGEESETEAAGLVQV